MRPRTWRNCKIVALKFSLDESHHFNYIKSMKAHYKFAAFLNDRFLLHEAGFAHSRESLDTLLEIARDLITVGLRVIINSSRDGVIFDSQAIPD